MPKYKNSLIYIFLILILYNLFVLPYFYKKILRCSITIKLDYNHETNQALKSTGEIIDNVVKSHNGIINLYSGQFIDQNNAYTQYRYYRIINKKKEECSEVYANLDRDLIKKTPNVNLNILKDIKAIARVSMFYIVNNIIILILSLGLYFLLVGKVSLKLKISKIKF
jgi:hypothetical protein